MNQKTGEAPGHKVVVTKRHVARFFDLMADEVTASMDLINEEKKIIDEEFNPDSYIYGTIPSV